jgi:hypothetical protein
MAGYSSELNFTCPEKLRSKAEPFNWDALHVLHGSKFSDLINDDEQGKVYMAL